MSVKRPHRKPRFIAGQFRRLRERDGDYCWLCLKPIDFTITSMEDPMRPSRDHVVPVALGGTDEDQNMRLAHDRCNVGRGTSDPPVGSVGRAYLDALNRH
jgi:hypothetical protein